MIKAAKEAFAHEFIMELPDQYETFIGKGSNHQLSGGEKQRIAIARALIKNPSILILDEATSSLDAESEMKVKTALENAMEKRTVLIIAHRLTTLEKADQIAVLKDGKVENILSYKELSAIKND